jgi:hypothetical protein
MSLYTPSGVIQSRRAASVVLSRSLVTNTSPLVVLVEEISELGPDLLGDHAGSH